MPPTEIPKRPDAVPKIPTPGTSPEDVLMNVSEKAAKAQQNPNQGEKRVGLRDSIDDLKSLSEWSNLEGHVPTTIKASLTGIRNVLYGDMTPAELAKEATVRTISPQSKDLDEATIIAQTAIARELTETERGQFKMLKQIIESTQALDKPIVPKPNEDQEEIAKVEKELAEIAAESPNPTPALTPQTVESAQETVIPAVQREPLSTATTQVVEEIKDEPGTETKVNVTTEGDDAERIKYGIGGINATRDEMRKGRVDFGLDKEVLAEISKTLGQEYQKIETLVSKMAKEVVEETLTTDTLNEFKETSQRLTSQLQGAAQGASVESALMFAVAVKAEDYEAKKTLKENPNQKQNLPEAPSAKQEVVKPQGLEVYEPRLFYGPKSYPLGARLLDVRKEGSEVTKENIEDAQALLNHHFDQALEAGSKKFAYSLASLATKLDPNNVDAWIARAKTAETLDERISLLRQANSLDPDDKEALSDLEEAESIAGINLTREEYRAKKNGEIKPDDPRFQRMEIEQRNLERINKEFVDDQKIGVVLTEMAKGAVEESLSIETRAKFSSLLDELGLTMAEKLKLEKPNIESALLYGITVKAEEYVLEYKKTEVDLTEIKIKDPAIVTPYQASLSNDSIGGLLKPQLDHKVFELQDLFTILECQEYDPYFPDGIGAKQRQSYLSQVEKAKDSIQDLLIVFQRRGIKCPDPVTLVKNIRDKSIEIKTREILHLERRAEKGGEEKESFTEKLIKDELTKLEDSLRVRKREEYEFPAEVDFDDKVPEEYSPVQAEYFKKYQDWGQDEYQLSKGRKKTISQDEKGYAAGLERRLLEKEIEIRQNRIKKIHEDLEKLKLRREKKEAKNRDRAARRGQPTGEIIKPVEKEAEVESLQEEIPSTGAIQSPSEINNPTHTIAESLPIEQAAPSGEIGQPVAAPNEQPELIQQEKEDLAAEISTTPEASNNGPAQKGEAEETMLQPKVPTEASRATSSQPETPVFKPEDTVNEALFLLNIKPGMNIANYDPGAIPAINTLLSQIPPESMSVVTKNPFFKTLSATIYRAKEDHERARGGVFGFGKKGLPFEEEFPYLAKLL